MLMYAHVEVYAEGEFELNPIYLLFVVNQEEQTVNCVGITELHAFPLNEVNKLILDKKQSNTFNELALTYGYTFTDLDSYSILKVQEFAERFSELLVTFFLEIYRENLFKPIGGIPNEI